MSADKELKLIIAGSRDILVDSLFVNSCVDLFRLKVDEVVSGNAQGVDAAGEDYSNEFLDKDAKIFHADWTKGAAAGPKRNRKMAEYADALLLIWDGESDGSANMKQEMMKKKKPVYEIIVRTHDV